MRSSLLAVPTPVTPNQPQPGLTFAHQAGNGGQAKQIEQVGVRPRWDGRFPSQKMPIPWPHGWKGLWASRTPNHPGLHANASSGEEATAVWNWSTESLNHLGWKTTAKIIESIQMRTICVLWIAVIWLCLCVLPRMAQQARFSLYL